MCLLKPNEQNLTNCTHEECRNFRMLNKPACMYSFGPQATKQANLLVSPSQPQNQSLSALQLPSTSEILGARNSSFLINTSNASGNEAVEDDDSFVLNKKKVRVESNNTSSTEAKSSSLLGGQVSQMNMLNPQFQQFAGNNVFEEKTLFNAPILNNLLMNGGSTKPIESKPANVQYAPISQPFYMPIMQPQMSQMAFDPSMMQNISFIPVQQNLQQPAFQNLVQNIKVKPGMDFANLGNNYVSPDLSDASRENNNKGFNLEEYMGQFQSKLTEVLMSQNKMLIDLREKNEIVQDTLACLINEVNALKQVVKQNRTSEKTAVFNKTAPMAMQFADNSREIASADSLLNSLYGPNHEFQYQLVFKNELPLPLYRERNFKFTVFLTDKDGNLVKNTNRIPLSLAIYTSENPPKFIDVNTSGNKILKGVIDKDMVDGAVTFDKIQIKEVTSHFRNGWIFFVVYPKAAGIVFNNMMSNGNTIVDHNKLRPLVLEKVVVKAKKIKEKNNDGIQDDESVEQEA